jgi:hypothetical protein
LKKKKIDVKLMVFLLFPFDVQNAPCVLPRFGIAALLVLHVHIVFVEPCILEILLSLVVWCRRKQEICRCKLLGSAKNESQVLSFSSFAFEEIMCGVNLLSNSSLDIFEGPNYMMVDF